MSKFYGQVFGDAKTNATRQGNRQIEASAQSWHGSVQTRLYYSKENDLMVDIGIADGRTTPTARSTPR